MPETTPTFILDGHNILYAARPAFFEVTRDIKLARRARKRGAAAMEPGAFLAKFGA